MKKKMKILLGTILGVSTVAGIAFATPTTGAFGNTVFSVGTITQSVFAFSDHPTDGSAAGVDWPAFKVALETSGPVNIIQQEVSFMPGGYTGWHKHPGLLLLTLAADSGPVDWYDEYCHKTVYKPGDSWTEGTTLHSVVNSGSIPAHFLITYVIAAGVEKRIGETAPSCAAAAGLQ